MGGGIRNGGEAGRLAEWKVLLKVSTVVLLALCLSLDIIIIIQDGTIHV